MTVLEVKVRKSEFLSEKKEEYSWCSQSRWGWWQRLIFL